jgi:ABC-2 type transport system permease protein
MSKFLALFRAGLKANFGLSLVRYRIIKQKKDLWLVPAIALGIVGIGPLFYYYLRLIRSIYQLLEPMHQQYALLTLGFLTGQLFILLFGLFYVISAFYFSKDLELLIPLPVRPFQVMMSKFGVILANEYLTVALLVLPVLVYFGVLARAGVMYWVEAALIYLFLPVIPLALVSLLIIVLMRFVNLGRKKDALIVVGSIFLIVMGMSLQFWLNRSSGAAPDPQAMVKFFVSPDSLLNKIGARFPPSIWATKALAGGFSASGLAHLFLFAGTSLLLLVGMVAGAEALFYRGLVGLGESGRRRSISWTDMSQRVSSGRHPVRAVLAREWRLMNRTPIFLLNGVLTVVIIPVVILLMATAGSSQSDFASLFKLLNSTQVLGVVLASAAFMTVCGTLNGTSSSTFSREGSQFWISKVIPASPREQVTAKFLHSYIIALLGIAAGSAVLLLQFHIRLALYAVALALALAAAFVLTAVGMTIDLARPLLDWTNPQKAIKQNLNVLLAFLADIAILTILVFFCIGLGKLGMRGGSILAVLGLLLVSLSAFSWMFLVKFAEKRYATIEV